MRVRAALALVQAIPGPDWLLVYPFSWTMLLGHGLVPPAYAAALGLALLALLWWAVWRMGSRAAPLTWPAVLPAGFCVLDRASGRALHANTIARAYRQPRTASGAPVHHDFFVALRDAHMRQPRDMFELIALGPAQCRVHLLVTCVRAPYQAYDALWCVLTDVTRLKLTESRLRTLGRASRARGANQIRFLAIAGHEIRTPLHGALGHLELLASSAMSATQRELLDITRQALRTLARRVEDVFDLSIAASGHLRIARHPFDPADTLEAAARAFAPLMRQRRQHLRCSIAPDLPRRVYGDAGRLRQILDNLLSNAMKFTDGGEIVLRLRVMPRRDGGRWLVFDVQDNGIGIAPEHQSRLFRPFSQAHPGIASTYGGTGIGLALCRQLCEQMGGRLTLDSEPGRGSRFTLMLPCDAVAPTDTTSSQLLAPFEPTTVPWAVLVVEDDDICRRLLARQLASIGCARIDTATDGDEAIRLCQRHPYDVVLMDWQLPGLSGNALAAAIRSYAADIRIIAVTADAALGTIHGIDIVLRKPLGLDVLRTALARIGMQHLAPNYGAEDHENNTDGDTSLIDAFVHGYDSDIGTLRQRWARGEFDGVLTGLHRIKGALLMLGADGPAALNEAVADALRAGDTALAKQRLAAFEAAMSAYVASAATSCVVAPPAR